MKILDQVEERQLITAARQGDQAARDKLWVSFFEFSRKRARYHARFKALDESEAESLANEAFLWALERFDLRRKVRFSTYLDYHLRGWMEAGSRLEQREQVFSFYLGPRERKAETRFTANQVYDYLFGRWFALSYPAAFKYLCYSAHRHDKVIARNLWNRVPPRSQSWVAKYLKVSRSAVCQRRQKLISDIEDEVGNRITKQYLERELLNKTRRFRYIELKKTF